MAVAFQTKTFTSIVASMINRMRGTQTAFTDFTVGSVGRTLVEAPAIEIDEMYQQLSLGLLAAIPIATYNTFSFPALPAVSAAGLLSLVVSQSSSALTIPVGTVFTPTQGGGGYATTAAANDRGRNTTGQVPVSATTAGSAGNIPAGQSFSASPTPTGFVSAINAAAFINGQDAESDPERQARFQAYIASLRGATDQALQYGAGQATVTDAFGNIIERAKYVIVVDPTPPEGEGAQPVSIYIHNGVGDTSDTLVANAQQIITGYTNSNGVLVPGYKVAGVPTTVYAASDETLNVTGVISVAAGYVEATLVAQAQAAVANYIASLAPNQPFLLAEAYLVVMSIAGVTNFVPSSPASPGVTPTTNAKFIAGTLAITGA